jgi:uncharacterized protein YkwD
MFSELIKRPGPVLSGWSTVLLVFCACQLVSAQELKEFDTDFLASPADGPELGQAEQAIIRKTNELRQHQGLSRLKTDDRLQKAAAYFAAYMARTNKYGHGADGNRASERVSLFGYEYCLVAENIAFQLKSAGFATDELSRRFFNGWKESSEHLDNMLQPHVTETGVAIGHSSQSDRYFAVQLFARPRSAAIEFQVANQANEPIRYTVRVAGSDENQGNGRSFDLPPRATMFHTRCRSTKIDWGWTDDDDQLEPRDERVYVVTKDAEKYQVAEKRASE